jgi:hypothetical protein
MFHRIRGRIGRASLDLHEFSDTNRHVGLRRSNHHDHEAKQNHDERRDGDDGPRTRDGHDRCCHRRALLSLRPKRIERRGWVRRDVVRSGNSLSRRGDNDEATHRRAF